jgi:uncharacterized protein YndB with AHSA1/START domain
MTGTLEQDGGRWRLRFSRDLAHPQDRVWRAITEPEHLQAWFPHIIKGDWIAGAPLIFVEPGGRAPDSDGEVLAFVPQSLVEFRWGPDLLRMELEPSQGGCTLTLLHTFGEQGKAARDAAGWHVCLDHLAAHLGDAAPPAAGRWAEVHPGYVEAFGPEAATIAPPPGY